MAHAKVLMPEYIPAPSVATNAMQQVLKRYNMLRVYNYANELSYCNGGVMNASVVFEERKYVLKVGLVTEVPDNENSPIISKIRVITVLVYDENGKPREDGFIWDSSNGENNLYGPDRGVYKTLYRIYRSESEDEIERLDNCVRIASGFYNTMKNVGVEPALFTDHKTLIGHICTINWAELIGEWIISPLTHHSMVAFPLKHKPRESYPANYRAAVNRRMSMRMPPKAPVKLPSYYEALLSDETNFIDFWKVISLLLSTHLGELDEMVIALAQCDFGKVDPDAVIAQLAAKPEYGPILRQLTEHRKTVPVDPVGLCPRIFLLAFQKDSDYIYMSRKLIETDQGFKPYSWPEEQFRGLTVEPYAPEQSSGAPLRNKYVPKNVSSEIHRSHSLNVRKRIIWDSMRPQIRSPIDDKETDSFIGFLKGWGTEFGHHVGYDVSRDPGPLALTNGFGGKVIRLSSWKWSRILRAQFGPEVVRANLERRPCYNTKHGTGTTQVVFPICNGLVHYVTPPIPEEILDPMFDQANDAKHRYGGGILSAD